MRNIIVEEYNTVWKAEFKKAKTFYEKVLKDIEVEIVHVGSTSYVCTRGSENMKNHLLLQKHLLNNKTAVKKYSTLKRNLAKKYPQDIDLYVEGKTELIKGFLKTEGMGKDELERIESINKKG